MVEIKKEKTEGVSLKHSLAFASGSFPDVYSFQAFTFLVFTFYFTIVGINVVFISIGFAIWSVWNAFNDPLLGNLSDRTHTKWGRRIPWLMVSIVPLGIIMILLFTPPLFFGISGEIPNFIYFLIIIIVFEFFYTMFSINQTSLFPEQFIDKEARAKVNNIKQLIIVVALVFAFILPTLFIPDLTDKTYLQNYVTFGIITCILVIIVGLVFLKWGAREKEEFRDDYKNQPGLFSSIKTCVKNDSFRWMAFSNIMVWFVFGMTPTILPLYGKFVLGIDDSIYIALMLALLFISATIFITVWRFVVIKLGPRKTWIIALSIWILTLIPLLFISAFYLRDLTWADIIDEDELKTGVRREGSYYGANALFMRLSTILIFLAISLVFSNIGWAVYAPEKVTPEVIFGLRLLMAVFPIIALVIAIFGFYMYPLHGKRLSDVKEQLAKLHAEKKSKV